MGVRKIKKGLDLDRLAILRFFLKDFKMSRKKEKPRTHAKEPAKSGAYDPQLHKVVNI
jgi:hypothetical protein